MFGADVLLSQTLTIQADPGADGEIFYMLRAMQPLTIESAYMVSEQTQNAGTAVQLRLEKWTSGTAVGGTITSYLGGTATADILTARVPSAAATVDRAQNYVAAGDWLVARYTELGAGWISGDRFAFTVNYVLGKGNTTSTS